MAKDGHCIKAFSEDDSLKVLGELLSNDSSRNMIKALSSNEMYANQIATKLNLRPNLVAYHLGRMESIGLLEITHKKIIRKGKEHKHFRIPDGMLVLPCLRNEDGDDGLVRRVMRSGVKFAAIGAASVVPLAIGLLDTPVHAGTDYDVTKIHPDAIIAGMGIAIVGLVMERIHAYRKNRRR